jgi:hypothetical protein
MSAEVTIPLRSHDEAVRVLGPYDRNAKLLRQSLDIEIFARSGNLRIAGNESDVATAVERIEHLLGKLRKGRELDSQAIEAILIGERSESPSRDLRSSEARSNKDSSRSVASRPSGTRSNGGGGGPARVFVPRPRAVAPRGENQRRYLEPQVRARPSSRSSPPCAHCARAPCGGSSSRVPSWRRARSSASCPVMSPPS